MGVVVVGTAGENGHQERPPELPWAARVSGLEGQH
jgi:hypothetical protein